MQIAIFCSNLYKCTVTSGLREAIQPIATRFAIMNARRRFTLHFRLNFCIERESRVKYSQSHLEDILFIYQFYYLLMSFNKRKMACKGNKEHKKYIDMFT